MGEVQVAVQELRDAGVRVLSPEDPRIVDAVGEFLFVASDRLRSIRLVQDRHNEAIAASDFLWVVVRDGYIGQSTCFEIGYAQAVGTPVYTDTVPANETLLKYVTVVPSISAAVVRVSAGHTDLGALLDPCGSIERAHYLLDDLRTKLENATDECECSVRRNASAIRHAVRGM